MDTISSPSHPLPDPVSLSRPIPLPPLPHGGRGGGCGGGDGGSGGGGGRFDRWRAGIGGGEAFIIASTASEEEMLRWYNERVVWNVKQLNLKLLRKGVLTRIYTPMAIVQGLREYGVFTSAITAGQSLVNDKVSLKTNNVQKKNDSKHENLSRKFIRANSQASARKILHAIRPTYWDSDVYAVPPLSPPSWDDHHKLTK